MFTQEVVDAYPPNVELVEWMLVESGRDSRCYARARQVHAMALSLGWSDAGVERGAMGQNRRAFIVICTAVAVVSAIGAFIDFGPAG